jgi:beta-1,2-mannobiose phosphorylase / 1,2-beta-oligomannan phosphorylase
MNVHRFPENPIVTQRDVKPSIDGWEVMSAFNAGVIDYGDEILMLMRVAERPVSDDPNTVLVPVMSFDCEGDGELKVLEFDRRDSRYDFSDPRIIGVPGGLYLTSISHLRLARSKDGRRFVVQDSPSLWPDQPYEAFGLEDPRITRLGDTYYVVYKGVAPSGITQCLASTKDFLAWTKHGIIFPPENMDAMIFPGKVRGKYVALHRPQPKMIGAPNMWIAYSDDLIHWGEHEFLMACSSGTWEGGRIGGGAVPFMTERGWLEIYHAATPDDRYCLGGVLLDAEHPERVIAKSPYPILEPEAPYETSGFKANVVFTCGAIVRGDTVTIYYGASDEVMAAAEMSVTEILDSLQPA